MMKLKKKNNLDFSVGIFWIVTGFFTLQASWFILSIPFASTDLWFQVLEATNKNAFMNYLVALFLFIAGIFQGIFGIFMAITRDNSLDNHVSKKKIHDYSQDDMEREI